MADNHEHTHDECCCEHNHEHACSCEHNHEDINKDQFDYYESFFTFSSMMSKIIELEKIQENQSKTENDYLIEYMEKSNDIGYKKIIEQMKVFKIQKKQYNAIIDNVKEEIKDKISELYEKYSKRVYKKYCRIFE